VLPLMMKTTGVKVDPIYMDNMKVSFSHGQSFKCRHYCQSPIQFIYSLLPSSPAIYHFALRVYNHFKDHSHAALEVYSFYSEIQ
jgi:hypothetical protein